MLTGLNKFDAIYELDVNALAIKQYKSKIIGKIKTFLNKTLKLLMQSNIHANKTQLKVVILLNILLLYINGICEIVEIKQTTITYLFILSNYEFKKSWSL